MSVGWYRCFVTLPGKKQWLEYCMEPPPWTGTVRQSGCTASYLMTRSSANSHHDPKKRPAIRVAQPWADKQVCCLAVATAGASRRPLVWTERSSPYKVSQSKSFPPDRTSTQKCKLEVYGKTILQARGSMQLSKSGNQKLETTSNEQNRQCTTHTKQAKHTN